MKKTVLFFLTSITAIWFIDLVLSGFVFAGGPVTVSLVALFIISGGYFTDWIASKTGTKTLAIFIVGVLVNFFSLYLASQFLPNFSINPGSLSWLNLNLIQTMDQILMLLLGSFITTLVSTLTAWASGTN